jgi:hypothetical protein
LYTAYQCTGVGREVRGGRAPGVTSIPYNLS